MHVAVAALAALKNIAVIFKLTEATPVNLKKFIKLMFGTWRLRV
jgi:hypothetical protein